MHVCGPPDIFQFPTNETRKVLYLTSELPGDWVPASPGACRGDGPLQLAGDLSALEKKD